MAGKGLLKIQYYRLAAQTAVGQPPGFEYQSRDAKPEGLSPGSWSASDTLVGVTWFGALYWYEETPPAKDQSLLHPTAVGKPFSLKSGIAVAVPVPLLAVALSVPTFYLVRRRQRGAGFPIEPRPVDAATRSPHNPSPQYLQYVASASCPAFPQAEHRRSAASLSIRLRAPANSAVTMPVGTTIIE